MNAPGNHNDWLETNQQSLNEEFLWLRDLLENATREPGSSSNDPSKSSSLTLDFLTERFHLSNFERSIVLLCAAFELHSEIRPLCARFNGDKSANYITFGFALSFLPEAHWTALAPDSALRFWDLIRVSDPEQITNTRITLEETILHFLLGSPHLDSRLETLVQRIPQVASLVPSQKQQMERLTGFWRQDSEPPIISLQGDDPFARLGVAVHSCAELDLQPLLLQAYDIPAAPNERNMLARLFTRVHLLSGTMLLIDGGKSSPLYLAAFIEQLGCPLLLLGDPLESGRAAVVKLEINRPTTVEQKLLWHNALSNLEDFDESELTQLTSQFDLTATEIHGCSGAIISEVKSGNPFKKVMWQQCRRHGRGSLDQLAQRINSQVSWDDLVLPEGKKAILKDISRQIRHRTTVYDTWGFADKSRRGLGISALFSGESGTGKTMAAELLATDLNLDIYRIDLSSVVSKYIGETEKNLEKLFRAAESSGAILLFDEADALFGKRTEIKDSHDRYANIELAYLLQRMESYRGLSILTSNMKSALDTAFLRRIRFVIQFPFPDVKEREAIWQCILPDKLPRTELKLELLARLHVSGGNIRNIALNGAFMAAEKGQPLTMADLAQAARLEYAKLEKPLNEAELRRWI